MHRHKAKPLGPELLSRSEDLHLEFKSAEVHLDSVVESVAAMANAQGGVLVVGVQEKPHQRVDPLESGPEPDKRLRPEWWAEKVRTRTIPPVQVQVHCDLWPGGTVALLEVPPGRGLHTTTRGVYKVRAIKEDGTPTNRVLDPSELAVHHLRLLGKDLSAMPLIDATLQDLDPEATAEARRLAASPGRPSALRRAAAEPEISFLASLGLLNGLGEPNLAALLLLGRPEALRRLVPQHEVSLQVQGHGRWLRERGHWPLLEALRRGVDAVEQRAGATESRQGAERLVVPELPIEAVREAWLNALVHRDYGQAGEVALRWEDQRLEITNPGHFPEGFQLSSALEGPSLPRNPALMEALRLLGLAERLRSGIRVVHSALAEWAWPAPKWSLLPGDWGVSFAMNTTEPDPRFATQIARPLLEAFGSESLDGAAALGLMAALHRLGPCGEARLRQEVPLRPEALDAVLQRLQRLAWVEKHLRTWRLSAKAQRALGQPERHVVESVPSGDLEGQVLAWIRLQGSVKRSDVERLSGLAPRQCQSLLKRWVEAGILRQEGSRRGSHYLLGDRPTLQGLTGDALRQQLQDLMRAEPERWWSMDELDEALAAKGLRVGGNNARNHLTGVLSRRKQDHLGNGRGRYRLNELAMQDNPGEA